MEKQIFHESRGISPWNLMESQWSFRMFLPRCMKIPWRICSLDTNTSSALEVLNNNCAI